MQAHTYRVRLDTGGVEVPNRLRTAGRLLRHAAGMYVHTYNGQHVGLGLRLTSCEIATTGNGFSSVLPMLHL